MAAAMPMNPALASALTGKLGDLAGFIGAVILALSRV
jgi:hypothetical protein